MNNGNAFGYPLDVRFFEVDSLEAFQHAEVAVRVDRVGTTSFRLRYDIERVDPLGQGGQAGELSQAGGRRNRCAQVEITYVCLELNGRRKTPLPLGLREALVQDHS